MVNRTILLIDYDPRSIREISGTLQAAGFEVEVARDGIEGVAAFQRIHPVLTLVEAMIPRKHGFELCQELKKTPHGKRSPIVILTAVYKGRTHRNRALHVYGCDAYLEKPISEKALLAEVHDLLQLQRGEGAGDQSPDAGSSATELLG